MIAVWQAVVAIGIWPDCLLPGPVVVLQKLAQDAGDPGFWLAVGLTLERALGGYVPAVAVGLARGWWWPRRRSCGRRWAR